MKKVRIKNYNYYPRYEGKVGVVINERGVVWDVEMEDGCVITPYAPHKQYAQCEIVSEESEVINSYEIY